MDSFEIQRLIDEALDALRRADDVRAVAITDQLAAELPDDPVVRAMRAQALLSGETAKEAFEEARRAVELDEDNEYTQRLLALAAWRAERLSMAQRAFERAIELSGGRPEVLADYAWFMASRRGPKLAMGAAKAAIEADDNSSTAWAAMGLTEYRLRHRRQAESSLRRALQLDPNNLYAQSAMVALLQDRREDAKAEALAHLLDGVPGAEELVESVRSEAKRRRVAGILVERSVIPGLQEPKTTSPAVIWMIVVVAIAVVLYAVIRPHRLAVTIMCIIVPLLLLWSVKRLLD